MNHIDLYEIMSALLWHTQTVVTQNVCEQISLSQNAVYHKCLVNFWPGTVYSSLAILVEFVVLVQIAYMYFSGASIS